MTFDEIQQVIDRMLSVQLELQESQLRQAERLDQLGDRIDGLGDRIDGLGDRIDGLADRMNEQADRIDRLTERHLELFAYQERQQKLIDRLIGYSLTNETEHLNLEERMNALEQRINRMRN